MIVVMIIAVMKIGVMMIGVAIQYVVTRDVL
jgi:hypothetical protein